jgi:hypothetical protein
MFLKMFISLPDMVREELTLTVDTRSEEMICVWVAEAEQFMCQVQRTLVTDNWSMVTCSDSNLFTDNSMETPRFYPMAGGFLGEQCHNIGGLNL